MLGSTLLKSRPLVGGLMEDNQPAVPPLKLLPDDVHYYLGGAGRCTGQRRLFVFMPDDSGSVVGAGGNDPLSKRYAEARLAVRTLARACHCWRELVAVAHWDRSLCDVPPVGLNRLGTAWALSGLVQPVDAAGTSDLGPVLARVTSRLRRWKWAGCQVHLVVMSDFELTDADPAGVFERLNSFPGEVTALVLRSQPDQRLDSERVKGVAISQADEPGRLARALFGQVTEGRVGRWLV